jgi:hypothetical protein
MMRVFSRSWSITNYVPTPERGNDTKDILVPNLNLSALSLADFSQRLVKPNGIQIKRFTTLDTWKLNCTQHKTFVIIMTDNARLAAERAFDSKVGTRLDQANIFDIGRRSASKITGLFASSQAQAWEFGLKAPASRSRSWSFAFEVPNLEIGNQR